MKKRIVSFAVLLVAVVLCVPAFARGLRPVSLAKTLRREAAPRRTFVVINRAALAESSGGAFQAVLDACRALVNEKEQRILDVGRAHQKQFRKPLGDDLQPSEETTAKARWLRRWLSSRVRPGSTIVLLGDEKSLPTWQVRLGEMSLTTDSFFSDLDGDGVPDTAVSRIIGSPDMMVRQLRGKKDYGPKAVILCSEDTRIHLETRAFAKSLSRLGHEVAIRGARDDETLSASDLIIHFGHGSSTNISNRFGEAFVAAGDMPALPRSPIVFVDGCGTLPVGSPLLRSFLKQGAVAYVGSTATVQGMIPARFTNELVEHFLRVLAERPHSTLPQLLVAARAAYVEGHTGIAEKLRQLATTGRINVRGDESTHLLTVAEWVYYGDPGAVIPRVGSPTEMSRQVISVSKPVHLDEAKDTWQTSFATRPNDGQAVLALRADIPLSERANFRLSVRQNGKELSLLDSHRDTVYQNLGQDCRGGYLSGDTYRARFLIPATPGVGQQRLEVRMTKGSSAILTPGTEVDVWPPDFEKRIGLRKTPLAGGPRRIATREPVRAVGVAKLRPTGVARFLSLDLSSLFNRPHDSVRVGGGDNASFKTWFSEDRVSADNVPFFVRRTGDDVLVSGNNTENVFEIKGIEAFARSLHFLVWGYNRPSHPARFRVTFSDGSSQECELPLSEWTQGNPPVAFDFENTVHHFKHAAIVHQVIEIANPEKKIVSISSSSGTYGLIAITLEQHQPRSGQP